MFQDSEGIIPAVESLDQKAVWSLVFWRNSILLSTVAAPVCIPTNRALGLPFSPHPCQHLLVDLLMMAILTSVKQCLVVVLICISVMASEAEHPFIALCVLCMSSLEMCLFRSFAHFYFFLFFMGLVYFFIVVQYSCLHFPPTTPFAHFLIGLFVFLVLSHMNSLYILEIKTLSEVSLANMFPHMVGSLFILVTFF